MLTLLLGLLQLSLKINYYHLLSNKLYVLNADDGGLLWQHQGIFNNTTLIDSPKVAVDENIVIVPYSNGDFCIKP